MPTDPTAIRQLNRRLLPLYIAVFLQRFILWYAIEKVFMQQIGLTNLGISITVALCAATMVLVETPSGILADRWSRKGVLIIASVALAISSLICGLSTGPLVFVIGAVVWAIFYAMYSGTYDSVVYDTLLEELGADAKLERYLGRVKMADSIALVLSALAGGLVAATLGFRETFLWTVPIALASIGALAYFQEPQLHRSEPLGTVKEHVLQTFRSALGKRSLFRIVAMLLLLTIAAEMLQEFSQLWLIALGTAPALFGPAYALVIGTGGIAGYLQQHTTAGAGRRKKSIFAAYACALAGAVTLAFPVGFALIVTAQLLLGVSVVFLVILFTADLHKQLPSRIRAGAASAVSTVARILLIPGSLLFGIFSQRFSVFTAAWVLVALLVGGIVLHGLPRRQLEPF
jgi:predicted MFS family arabinose efflux permease